MTGTTITDEDRKKIKVLRSMMQPLGLNLYDVPDGTLMQAIAADANLHQALVVLIDVMEIAVEHLSAFIAANQVAIDDLDTRVRQLALVEDASNIEQLVGEAYELGYAHGGNARRLGLGEPPQRVDEGWGMYAEQIIAFVEGILTYDHST